MFPNPRKNMWQMKDNGWTPRQYPNDVYGGGPYVSEILLKRTTSDRIWKVGTFFNLALKNMKQNWYFPKNMFF